MTGTRARRVGASPIATARARVSSAVSATGISGAASPAKLQTTDAWTGDGLAGDGLVDPPTSAICIGPWPVQISNVQPAAA